MAIKLKENQYIKAMNKDMTCRGHKFEVGEEYKVEGELELCENGFHACKDINEILHYYSVNSIFTLVTFLGDVEYDEFMEKFVTNHIRIDKILSFEECVELDKTGEWCYNYARVVEDADIELLQKVVINKDSTAELCYDFAYNIKDANVELLQRAVIEKDKTGAWGYFFARDVKADDVELLQKAVIEKDTYGLWCACFSLNVAGSDVELLNKRLKELDYKI